ncbi:hypothetical protein [Rheinheimera sp. WS51]|uniref:hypothetical protein n=1 Tax=Rheinheimera sp. WS51 TaxID=3425886 RepID=UPI003D91A771
MVAAPIPLPACEINNNVPTLPAGFAYNAQNWQVMQTAVQEVQHVMEQTHMEVFGVSIAQRKPSELARRQQALKLGIYDYFDEPAFNRLQ